MMHPTYTTPSRAVAGQDGHDPVPNRKGAKRRLRLLFFLFACFVAWAAVTLWDRQEVVTEKQSELLLLEQELARVQDRNEAYRREIERLHDPEYIEQRLRKDHMMIKEGETLFIKTR